MKKVIYTHDEAMLIVEMFEDLLCAYDIRIPSPEDEERDEENEAALYGSAYDGLLAQVENHLVNLLARKYNDTEIIVGEFSGTV